MNDNFLYKILKTISKQLLTLFIFLLIISERANAQNKISDTDKNTILFSGNHISINLSRLEASKGSIKRTTGNYPLSSSVVPGVKLGLLYHIHFNTQYSLITGAEATVIGTNFILTINQNSFSPQLTQDYFFNGKHTRAYNLILSLPVVMEKRFWYNNKNFIAADLGIKLNYSSGADYDISDAIVEDVNNNFFKTFELNVDANNNAKPWVSYFLSAAHSWRLKNNNYLQLGIQYNLSFTKYINGSYSITIPDQSLTSGSYTATGTYTAICLSYIFTNGNYRLRKKYERKNISSL